jgi:Tfp pilus assembly protein PilN
MMTLNFLSAENKAKLARERHFLELRAASIVLLAIALFLSTVAWADIVLLQRHADSLTAIIDEKQSTQETTETKVLETKIKLFNTRVKTILDIEKTRLPVGQRLAEVFRAIPSGVSLEQLEADLGGKKLTLRGTARDRAAYLQLKDSMNATGFFTNLELPITDLLSRESIRFTLVTDLGPSFLEPLLAL